jgi:hypothetical protein
LEQAVPAFQATGSSRPRGRSGQGCRSAGRPASAVWLTVLAVGVDETKHGDRVRLSRLEYCGVECQSMVGERHAGGGDPLFSFVGVCRVMVGVEQ